MIRERVIFKQGDKVKVCYRHGQSFEGTVVTFENRGGFDWVDVRPNDPRYISTFGSARDMARGWKTYIANDDVLGKVFPI